MSEQPVDNALHLLIGGIASDTKHILAKLTVQDKRIDRHGDRLTVLERQGNRVIGMTLAISFTLPILIVGTKTFLLGG